MSQKTLSPLEQDVMNIVWDSQECSVRDVLSRLNQDKKFAYTTVATLLQRLFEKGLVSRNTNGLVLSYCTKVSKETYLKSVAKSFLETFTSSFGEAAIASFADSIDTLPKEKKEYFLELLEKQNDNT